MTFARLAAFAVLSLTAASPSFAQEPPRQGGAPANKGPQVEVPAAAKGGAAMQRFPGVWVEGPGYQITYGDTYDSCAKKCLAQSRCLMIEFYRPEKKCNLYDTIRPKLKGGSSDVAVRG